MDEWKLRPERGDNQWFNCLVGYRGLDARSNPATNMKLCPSKVGGRVSFAEIQRRKRA